MLTYKIFENVQIAKKILSENNIPENNEEYLKLKELLKKNNGYLGKFTKWLIVDKEPFQKIKSVFIELQKSNIDKPIDSFETLESLSDYITSFSINKKVNQVINSLPSHSRVLVNDKLKNLISLNSEYANEISKYYSNKGGRYSKSKDFEGLYNDTYQLIENLKGGFTLENMLEKIKPYNVEVVLANDDILVIDIKDYKASSKLGSQHWCISTDKNHWDSYVNYYNLQYFIYDFTKDRSDKKHMIGATVSPGNKITSAHWADDSSVNDLSYFDNL